jgi:hypothetical protein
MKILIAGALMVIAITSAYAQADAETPRPAAGQCFTYIPEGPVRGVAICSREPVSPEMWTYFVQRADVWGQRVHRQRIECSDPVPRWGPNGVLYSPPQSMVMPVRRASERNCRCRKRPRMSCSF